MAVAFFGGGGFLGFLSPSGKNKFTKKKIMLQVGVWTAQKVG
jgi:hypothetical protein